MEFHTFFGLGNAGPMDRVRIVDHVLDDARSWAAIEPHLPKNQPGARREDDRRVISGILHV